MNLYLSIVRLFIGPGVMSGLVMGLVTAIWTNWMVGLLLGLFVTISLAFGLPLFLFFLGRKNRGSAPIRFRFQIRTIFVAVGLVAFCLALWQWTNTIGVRQLRAKYYAHAQERLRVAVENQELRPTEGMLEQHTTNYFVNPRATFPFIIEVETDGSFRNDMHWGVRRQHRARRTHIWFFGYISEEL